MKKRINHVRFKLFSKWLDSRLGIFLLQCEQQVLRRVFTNIYGQRLLLLGDSRQKSLLKNNRYRAEIILSCIEQNDIDVCAEFSALPIEPSSIDCIVLPHILEFCEDSNAILHEVDLAIKSSGHVIILGFNPWSIFGLRQLFSFRHKAPWCGHFISAHRARNLMISLGFQILDIKRDFYPLAFFKWLSKIVPIFFSGIYVLTAQKNVVGLTLEKPKWKILDIILHPSHAIKPATRGAQFEKHR